MNTTGAFGWSKLELIAYSDTKSSDSNLCISFLETINGTNWRFHPPKRYIVHPQLYEEPNISNNTSTLTKSHYLFYDITSLYWNNWSSLSGDMLAVCDELGNMTMLIAGYNTENNNTYEHMTMLFQDNVYKLHNQIMSLSSMNKNVAKLERKQTKKEYCTSILDLKWVGNKKPVVTPIEAQRDQLSHQFKNYVQQCSPFGVFHPTSIKNACISIRRNGYIDFWYQFSNSKDFKKVSLQLSSIQDPRNKEFEWLEFAKIAHMEEDQCFLIGVFSKISNKFIFYKLKIDWKVNTNNPNILSDPEFQLEHLLDANPEKIGSDGEILQLDLFQIISRMPLPNSKSEICIGYRVCGTTNYIVKIFHLEKSVPNPEFVAILGMNYNQDTFKYQFGLSLVTSLKFDSQVLEITPHSLGILVDFKLHNSSFKIFYRPTWTLDNGTTENKNRIFSIFSAGFQYPTFPAFDSMEFCHISPSMCGVITKVKYKEVPIFYPLVSKVISDKTNNDIEPVSFALEFVRYNHRMYSGEDVTIAAKTHILRLMEINETKAIDFLTNLVSAIFNLYGLQLDGSKEMLDKILQSKTIQKILLLQMELGSSFKNSSIYTVAYTSMKLRGINLAINGVSRNIQVLIQHSGHINKLHNGKNFQFSFSKQDLIFSLIPSVRWFVLFITFITQHLISLVNNPESSSTNLILGLLGSKITRHLILKTIMELKNMVNLVKQFPETNYPVLNESSNFFRKVLYDGPIDLEIFETFLNDVNTKLNSIKDQQQVPKNQRESSFMIKSEILDDSLQVKDFLLSHSNVALLSHINLADVYFANIQSLRILNSEKFQPLIFNLLQPLEKGLVINEDCLPVGYQSSRMFSLLNYDDISSEWVNLSSGIKLKRCTRCGCVTRSCYDTNDNAIIPTSMTIKRWTALYTRFCYCTGMLYEI